jgi:hypothetical protein
VKQLICCLVALFAGAVLVGQEVPKPEPSALRARIVQLEEQLRQTQRSATVCAAQLALATEPAAAKAAQEKMAEAAKDMGCEQGVDWTVNPPACRQSKPVLQRSTSPSINGDGQQK